MQNKENYETIIQEEGEKRKKRRKKKQIQEAK